MILLVPPGNNVQRVVKEFLARNGFDRVELMEPAAGCLRYRCVSDRPKAKRRKAKGREAVAQVVCNRKMARDKNISAKV